MRFLLTPVWSDYKYIILYYHKYTNAVQPNFYIIRTSLGPHEVSWLKRCPYFRGYFEHFCTIYVAGIIGSVLTREVFLFQRSYKENLHQFIYNNSIIYPCVFCVVSSACARVTTDRSVPGTVWSLLGDDWRSTGHPHAWMWNMMYVS